MSDYLLDLGTKPLASKLVKQLKLPISLPQVLRRQSGPWTDEPLAGLNFSVAGAKTGRLCEKTARAHAPFARHCLCCRRVVRRSDPRLPEACRQVQRFALLERLGHTQTRHEDPARCA